MKKLIFLIALACAFVSASAQKTYPRLPYESNTLGNGSNLLYKYQTVRDIAGTGDTVWLAPSAFKTYISINNSVAGDSLNGTVTLAVIDTTVAAIRYNQGSVYKFDELDVMYKTPSAKRDTIKFAGLFETGVAAGYIITPVDAVQHTHYLHFVFDGTKFVQTYTGK